ncbi:MAG: OmpA family protein, partial [Bacteroidia bacterium]
KDKNRDTKDSIKKIEIIIDRILARYKPENFNVVCYSLDNGEDYKTWLGSVPRLKPVKEKPGYTVGYYNSGDLKDVSKTLKKLFGKLTLIGADGKLLIESESIEGFKVEDPEYVPEKTVLKAKLMTEEKGVAVPVPNTVVSLFGEKEDTLASTKTDKFGDFELPIPDANIVYKLKVSSGLKTNFENIIFATQEGKEVGRANKTSSGFEYKIMKAEIIKLSGMEEKEDLTLVFRKFQGGGENELKVIEYIHYSVASYSVEPGSEEVLNKIVAVMENYPKVKLEIISHTDATGDDASNLELSKKRSNAVADYLVSKGISKSRLKAIGKGETAIRNRCKNGVDCSDKEQKYNRRTEFNFTKPK